jgi:hypothetical protein
MAQLTQSERDLVDSLLECIAEAMTGADGVDSTYANKTKLQKLIYLAIDEFDLPITYSWYLAGAVLPEDAATPQTLQSAFNRLELPDRPNIQSDSEANHRRSDETIESNSTSESSAVDDSMQEDDSVEPILFSSVIDQDRSPPDHRITGTSIGDQPRSEIVDFYSSELPNVWHQNTMRFLQNFYIEYAPEKYRDLYIQSTHLRIRLKDLEEAVEARLNDEDPDTAIDELVRQAGLDISDLHMSIREQDSLRNTFEWFVKGTDLVEDALMVLSQQPPEELTSAHLDAMAQIQDFYYYYIWRYPCLAISKETATGPSADDLREARQNSLETFDSTLAVEFESLESQLTQTGLQSSYDDYLTTEDEVGGGISDLANQYFNQ